MREILFRGKTYKGEWLYGFYHNETSIESPSSDRKVTRHHIYTQDFDKFVIPETVGQFTGLTDKNGKKIFEGDICKHRSSYSGEFIISVVTYSDGCFLAMADKNSGFNLSDKLEVIGNIHDNPELLGE